MNGSMGGVSEENGVGELGHAQWIILSLLVNLYLSYTTLNVVYTGKQHIFLDVNNS